MSFEMSPEMKTSVVRAIWKSPLLQFNLPNYILSIPVKFSVKGKPTKNQIITEINFVSR